MPTEKAMKSSTTDTQHDSPVDNKDANPRHPLVGSVAMAGIAVVAMVLCLPRLIPHTTEERNAGTTISPTPPLQHEHGPDFSQKVSGNSMQSPPVFSAKNPQDLSEVAAKFISSNVPTATDQLSLHLIDTLPERPPILDPATREWQLAQQSRFTQLVTNARHATEDGETEKAKRNLDAAYSVLFGTTADTIRFGALP